MIVYYPYSDNDEERKEGNDMARTKGAKNKNQEHLPHYAQLPPKERIEFLAALIAERILEDQQQGEKLLNMQPRWNYVRPTAA